jgi:hypothetical protein
VPLNLSYVTDIFSPDRFSVQLDEIQFNIVRLYLSQMHPIFIYLLITTKNLEFRLQILPHRRGIFHKSVTNSHIAIPVQAYYRPRRVQKV